MPPYGGISGRDQQTTKSKTGLRSDGRSAEGGRLDLELGRPFLELCDGKTTVYASGRDRMCLTVAPSLMRGRLTGRLELTKDCPDPAKTAPGDAYNRRASQIRKGG